MGIGEITFLCISTVIALLAGMSAIIKSMVLGRLTEIQHLVTGLSKDMHRMDIRLTKLEAEHAVGKCMFRVSGDE